MINSLYIENFRGLQNLKIENMKRMTLISGKNNIGKSTVLEALFLLMDHSSSDSLTRQNIFRGSASVGNVSLWEPLFFNMNPDNTIIIRAKERDLDYILSYKKDSNYLPVKANGVSENLLAQFRTVTQNSYSLFLEFSKNINQRTEYHEEGHFLLNGVTILQQIATNMPGNEIQAMRPTQYVNASIVRMSNLILDSIGRLELQDKKSVIVKVLQELDPDITDILTLSIEGMTQLYLRVKGQLIPLQFAGDGVAKILNICLAIMEKKNGLVLIDELETGFHFSMYSKIWKMIDRLSQESNCQVIATTHSYELIAAVKDNLKNISDFTYFRMGKNRSGIKAYQYSYEMLGKALDSEMEVR